MVLGSTQTRRLLAIGAERVAVECRKPGLVGDHAIGHDAPQARHDVRAAGENGLIGNRKLHALAFSGSSAHYGMAGVDA